MAEDPIRDQKNLGEFMGNKTLKAGLFAALAAGALWVLPMTRMCGAGISGRYQYRRGKSGWKNMGRCPAYSRRKSEKTGGCVCSLNY